MRICQSPKGPRRVQLRFYIKKNKSHQYSYYMQKVSDFYLISVFRMLTFQIILFTVLIEIF